MARAFDIVAYDYRADRYCPACIVAKLGGQPTTDPERFLTAMADSMGVQRFAEWTYDSGDFPKVVFRDQLRDDDGCGYCGGKIS